jgi:serine/threonine-protein kinase
MLRDEARIAARIHHPNVVAVVDIGTQGDNHYIVMEYVEGPSFATLWKRSRDKRPLDLIVSVMIDTLEGLNAAHTLTDEEGAPLQLVHRDVSPQNILVGVDGVARITDFGIAKAESRIASTVPGMRKGKLQFMSPEQIVDAEKINLRTDIWAAGVLLYTLLTGEHLFRDDNDAATVHNVVSKEVPLPSTRGENPPARFDPIIMKALDRDPSKRFESALQMADELRKAAVECGVLGSRHEVARWVTTTFGEELESRRSAIREVTRRRSSPAEFREHSQVTVLPSLPSTLNNTVPDSLPSSATVPAGTYEEINPAEAIITLPPPGLEILPLPDEQPGIRKKRIALALAAGAALFLTAGLLFRSSSSKPPAAPIESPRVAAAATVAESPAEPVVSPAAASAVLDTREAHPPSSEKSGDSDKKTSHARRVVSARPAPRVEAPREPAPKPEVERPAAAEPALPRPTAAPQAEFEKNPYLRR